MGGTPHAVDQVPIRNDSDDMRLRPRLPWNRRTIWKVAAAVVFAAIVVGFFVFSRYWPFRREAVVQALESGLSTKVEVGKFRETFFPRPGCVLDQVVFGSSLDGKMPPPVTIQQLAIKASYLSFLRPGTQISFIRARGLQLFVPTYAHPTQLKGFPRVTGGRDSKFSIDRLLLENSSITVVSGPKDPDPLIFGIALADLGPLASGRAANFRLRMTNAQPNGEIQCAGKIGPWNSKVPGQTPLSGEFSFQRADLSTFKDIAGILSARGAFRGRLGDVAVKGSSDIPDFEVTRTRHPVHLETAFDANVDGIHGDTVLNSVNAHFGGTAVAAEGTISGGKDTTGKTVSLSMSVRNGRVQDLLHMFTKADPPALTGPISLTAKAVLPPEPRAFIQRLLLDGSFTIQQAKFTTPQTQENVKTLSERARGIKDDPPERIASDARATISMRDGLARISKLSFHVPGAHANMAGTYNLLTERIDLLGTLQMEVDLSRSTKGLKSALLKFVDPLFHRKHAGAIVPVKLDGTYSHPSFGFALTPKK